MEVIKGCLANRTKPIVAKNDIKKAFKNIGLSSSDSVQIHSYPKNPKKFITTPAPLP